MSLALTHVTFDCADAAATAAFWSAALGRPIDDGASPEYATLAGGAPGWMFIRVPEPKSTKNRVHPDLTTDDLEGELTRLKDLGATHLADHDEDGTRWATLADPEGNEFDVVAG
jgi:catechol 2,3-dioxygenase-like lactoylglutathione lyase family enzyme